MQGHIWRTGFQRNEIESVVFDDVPEALEKWHALGIKVNFTSNLFVEPVNFFLETVAPSV